MCFRRAIAMTSMHASHVSATSMKVSPDSASSAPSILFARTRVRMIASLVAACVFTLGPITVAWSQSPTLRCAELLTADQVKAIAGAGMAAARPKQHELGESECVWRRGNDAAAVSLSLRFFDRQAISANPVTRTLDGYYQMLVKAGEEAGDRKREPVAGVPRASLIQASPQILLLVQRPDGVARVVLGNLGRTQAVALAKLIAAP